MLRLMKWIEKNAENKIRLPEIPHISIELHEEYYKKKAILESYEENSAKDDLEIDDLINMDFANYSATVTTDPSLDKIDL